MALVGGAAVAWPFAVRAQQPDLPVIGLLGSTSPAAYAIRMEAFRQGLKQAGYGEGRNVMIESRWAEGRYDRLPALAAELVARHVAVIAAAGGMPAALAAKAATSTIPIVIATSGDPTQAGLVASLNRPGGNVTGVTNQNADVGPKRLELLREFLPKAKIIAVLVNPANPTLSEQFTNGLKATARTLGMQLRTVQASVERDLDTAFATIVEMHADALVIGPDVFFNGKAEELAARTLSHALPAVYEYRPFAAAGGLVSYGASETEYYRLVGIQVGKILDGKKPADLPVQQSTKVELIINLKTAKELGIAVPLVLSGRADELIE
jgi:putative tryptophan/tyrosine transport system substrate-binding protein